MFSLINCFVDFSDGHKKYSHHISGEAQITSNIIHTQTHDGLTLRICTLNPKLLDSRAMHHT